ncbi:hypothetical protein MTP99_002370 [Tenebrio molitor]|nr:hypothetical protein MTP99_002370 [Tenebrio molitor]CAH1378543.1 unnamed protein product [Tenebrio molitor]
MKSHTILFVSICILLTEKALSLSCISTACDTVDCPKDFTCGPGEVKARGGHCLCCDVCKKLVGEGVNCAADTPIAGQLSDKVACDKGLICLNGSCQKQKLRHS